MTIGERIKLRREELGMSQEDLAHKLGYKNRSSINKIELDKQNLRQSKIKAIADALETTPAFIMGWSTEETARTEADKKAAEATESINRIIKNIPYTEEELEMVSTFRSLDDEAKRQLILMMAFLKDQNK